ncbi:MAG: bifunctional nuclease family protein [Chitinophagales bacterium]
MKKIELNIVALANSESNHGNFAIILEASNDLRRLPIIIGPFEAQAIASSLQQRQPSRPMTHDLFKNTLDAAGVRLTEVFISKMESGVFHATLIGRKSDESVLEIDARSSDAIAMAVRFACPIFTTEAILQEAGIELEIADSISSNKEKELSDYSIAELNQILEEVLENEDYEMAAKIKEAIDSKK